MLRYQEGQQWAGSEYSTGYDQTEMLLQTSVSWSSIFLFVQLPVRNVHEVKSRPAEPSYLQDFFSAGRRCSADVAALLSMYIRDYTDFSLRHRANLNLIT